MKDSSGVRLYYTHAERTHRVGVLAVGDPSTRPGACSSSLLGKERNGDKQGITFVSEHELSMTSCARHNAPMLLTC